jgi:hypothetical protein
MTGEPLYRSVLGPAFDGLAPPLQRFHSLAGAHTLSGTVEVDAPRGALARLLARCIGAPLTALRGPLRFELDAQPARETWTRHFPGHKLVSTLRLGDGCIEERMGAARLQFGLVQVDGALHMALRRLRVFGVSCPHWLMPSIRAEEHGEMTGGRNRLHFLVEASVLRIGMVARYRGHLEMPGD